MKRTYAVLALLALIGVLPTRGNALEVVQNDTGTLNLEGFGQWLGIYENVPDDRNKGTEDRAFEYLKEAVVQADGNEGDVKFNVLYSLGDGSGSDTNNLIGLQDFSADVPLFDVPGTSVKIGQFLVPYGRENLTDDRTLDFSERSVESLGFDWNRDVGAALENYTGKWASTLAIMSGGGVNYEESIIPEKMGFPMTVLRVGYNDGVDKDLYTVNARDDNPASGFLHRDNANPDGVEDAAYLNGLYLRDSDVGHSTVLQVRSGDKPLIIDPDYNPFIAVSAAGPQTYSLANVYQFGGDAVYRAPFLWGTRFNSEAEYDYGHFDNAYGSLNIKGGRAQAGLSKGKWEVNARYSILYLDTHMANTVAGSAATYTINQHTGLITLTPAVPTEYYPISNNDRPINEITPSVTYHYRPNVLVVGELPLLLDMPVYQDTTSGNYVMSEEPDESIYDKGGGTVARRNIYEARVMIQFMF